MHKNVFKAKDLLHEVLSSGCSNGHSISQALMALYECILGKPAHQMTERDLRNLNNLKMGQ